MKGGRRTDAEKANPKCHGQIDAATQEPIDPNFAIRLKENNHYFCFDIRSLHTWFSTGKRTNPETNINFSEANIAKIQKKFIKAGLNADPAPQTNVEERDLLLMDLINNNQAIGPFDIAVKRPYNMRYFQYRLQGFLVPDEEGPSVEYEMMIVPQRRAIVFFTRNQETFDNLVRAITQRAEGEPDYIDDHEAYWHF
jgi:hypothetical protein